MAKHTRLIEDLEKILRNNVKNTITINEEIQKMHPYAHDPEKTTMVLSKKSKFVNMSYVEKGANFKQSSDYGLAKEVLKDYARHLLDFELEYLTKEQMRYVLRFLDIGLTVPETGPGSMKKMSLLTFQKKLQKVEEAYERLSGTSAVSLEMVCEAANV